MDLMKQGKVFGIVVIFMILGGCAGQMQEDGASDSDQVAPSDVSSTSDDSSSATVSNAEGSDVAEEQAVSESSGADVSTVSGSEVGEEGGSLKDAAEEADVVFYFDFDRSDLKTASLDDLDTHARYLESDSSVRIRLEGHADERGTRAYNLALGERRANAVVRYLVIQGVDRGQIETISYGEERPSSLVRSESGWQKNRRVELIYR